MSTQNPTASDLASFVGTQDQKNADLGSRARSTPGLAQSDPTWVRDWNAYMTRYVRAREVASSKVSASAGQSLDDVPAPAEYEALARAVRIYDAAQSNGDFDDLAARVSRAAQAPRSTGGHLTWSQVRSKLNSAGAIPALPVVEQGGDDVIHALASFQAMNGLPSTGKLSSQTLQYLSAHGEAEKNVNVWKARFGGANLAQIEQEGRTLVGNFMKSDTPKYIAAGAVVAIVAKALGASALGVAAAGAGGVALAAFAILHPRQTA